MTINKYIDDINSLSNYISRNDIDEVINKYNLFFKRIVNKVIYFKYYKQYKNLYKYVDIHNERYLNEKIKNDYLLDNIKGYKLDNEQKKAVFTNEDNTLVAASAGSGKTLTIMGKIRYLVEEDNISLDEILCVSFTNESSNNLKNELKNHFNYDIDVYTFHKLGLNIIKYFYDEINISSSDYLEYIIDEIIDSNFNYVNKNIKIYLKKNICTFIKLYKSSGKKLTDFNKLIDENNKDLNIYRRKVNRYFLLIIKYFYYEYEKELNSQNLIDFDDMIIKSINLIKENGCPFNYKYIIIDEYQDTSYVRFKLINEIKKVCNSKILAVGDDFQSIYRFTGCNLDIFLKFEKYFGYSKLLKIQNTYRNSIELITVSSNFIMKNKSQIKKEINSNKHNKKPIKIYYYNNKNELVTLINKIYENEKILILGRNNNDLLNYIDDLSTVKDKIDYLTIHKSKGLEYNNVVMIGVIDDNNSIPSRIQNEYIMKYVLNEKEVYPFEEERRLFYVALTRTKNNIYFFTKKNHESVFLKEIINDSKKYIEYI